MFHSYVARAIKIFLYTCGITLLVKEFLPKPTQESLRSKVRNWVSIDLESDKMDNPVACRVTIPNPWDESIEEFAEFPEPLRCEPIQAQLSNLFQNNSLIIDINKPSKEGKIHNCTENPRCWYSCFEGDPDGDRPDDDLTYTDFQRINEKQQTFISCPFFRVICKCTTMVDDSSSSSEKEAQTLSLYNYSYYNFIPDQEGILKSYNKLAELPTNASLLSVMLIVLDSTSHSNAIRMLPKTLKYLEDDLHGFTMDSFTKVGDNSKPNAAAFLFGRRSAVQGYESEVEEFENLFLEDWPVSIWNEFHEAGYMSFLEEDWWPQWHVLQDYGQGPGFKNVPFNHYLKPFWLDAYENLVWENSAKYCYDTTPNFVLNMKHLESFVQEYLNRPTLSLSWYGELCHDHMKNLNLADDYFLAHFQSLKQKLNNSILFILGDHGHRFDSIRLTPVGRMEERLPIFSVVLPQWLRDRHPEIVKNLQENKNLLSSHFDVYVTMKDIYHYSVGNFTWDGNQMKSQEDWNLFGAIRGQSLFRPLNPMRTCKQAGIVEEFCMCRKEESLDIMSNEAIEAAELAMEHMNKMLKNVSHLCEKLQLKELKSAEKIFSSNDLIGIISLRISLVVTPGDGAFELNLRAKKTESSEEMEATRLEVFGDINRINAYGTTSLCVKEDDTLRKICLCKSKMN